MCESISIDQATNQVSVFNILEDLYPQKLPYVLPKTVAVSSWAMDQEEADQDWQVALRISPPGEQEKKAGPTNFGKGWVLCRSVISVQGIPVKEAGELKFELLLNGESRATQVVTVHPVGTKMDMRVPEKAPGGGPESRKGRTKMSSR